MPGIKKGMIPSPKPFVLTDDDTVFNYYDFIGIYPQLNGLAYLAAFNTITIAIKRYQRTGIYPGRTFRISVKRILRFEQVRLLFLKYLPDGFYLMSDGNAFLPM
jgi:hypothetical protein